MRITEGLNHTADGEAPNTRGRVKEDTCSKNIL